MHRRNVPQFWLFVLVVVVLIQACGTNAPAATGVVALTDTPQPPKATDTAAPSSTATADPNARPTRTPNLTATYNAENRETLAALSYLTATLQAESWNTEVQSYFDAGYLTTIDGKFVRFNDYEREWAQLGWYSRYPLRTTASDFYMSAHLKWSSAYRSADTSGCGFVFAEQQDGSHYGVFLDRSRVVFVQTDEYYDEMGATRGTGRVDFGNPFDAPIEADLTLIVQGTYAYVLVDGEVVGEYTLAQSKAIKGTIGLAMMSGTNKDFGTRCEMTNIHAWLPAE